MGVATSDKNYLENQELWGENQFTTLKDIIDQIQLLADDDSYFKKLKRFRMSILGKICIKELQVDLKQEKKAVSFELNSGKTFPYPRYMFNWFRISFVTDGGTLQEIDVNNKGVVAEYLQDDDFELLYDISGNILQGDVTDYPEGISIKRTCDEENKVLSNQKPKVYWVKDVHKHRYFEFSEDLVEKEIVIEFISAGLESLKDSEIKVHQIMEPIVTNYIKWKALEGKRNVPGRDAMYFYELYKKAKKRARRHLDDKISIDQILEAVSLRYNGT